MTKKRNDIEVEDITSTSQYDGMQVLKDAHSLPGHYLRVRESLSTIPEHFDSQTVDYNVNNLPETVCYYKATKSHSSIVGTVADVSGSLNSKYMFISDAKTGRDYTLYFSVNAAGVDPNIPNRTSIVVNINTNDVSAVVAQAIKLSLESFAPESFIIERQNSVLTIKNSSLGEISSTADVDTGFVVTNNPGEKYLIRKIFIAYDSDNNPIYNNTLLKGYKYNITNGRFELALNSRQDTISIGNPTGEAYSETNPLPVQLSDGSISIGSVNAELEVQLSRKDNDPDAGDVHDAVRIGNQDVELDFTNEGAGKGEAKVHDQDTHTRLDTANANLDSIELKLDNVNTELDNQTIELQQIEADLESIDINVQSLETTLVSEFDATQAKQDVSNSELSDINTELDLIRSNLNSQADETQIKLDTANANLDSLEVKLDGVNAELDLQTTELQQIEADVESVDASVQSLEATVQAEFDATQIKQDTTNTELSNINTELDGIRLDLNTQSDETQVKLDTANANLDSIELKLDAVNTELDSQTIELQQIEADVEAVNTSVQSLETTVQTEFDQTQIKQDTANTELSNINTELDGIRSDLNLQSDETQIKLDGVNTELDNIYARQADKTQYTQITDGTNDLLISSDGSLPIKPLVNDPNETSVVGQVGGKVISNSTETPLGASANFTGPFVNCEQFNSISVSILTDQVSAIDGAIVEFSTDGTVAGIVKVIKTTIVPTTDGLYFSVPCEAKFFRLNYTNNVFAQSVFKVDTSLKLGIIGVSALPLIAPLSDNNSVPINRSIITGRGLNDNYSNQRSADVSTKNSTSTPLLASGTFTGDWEEVIGYSNISILISSDQDSIPDGLCIEWSSDGVNVDDKDCFDISQNIGNGGRSFTFGIIARYFRVKYINSTTDQTYLRLQTLLHIARPKPSSHRVEGDINGQNDAELVKAVITGRDPNGVFVNKRTGGVIDDNSTTTLLAASQSFIGEWFDLSEYGGVTASLFSDVDGHIKFEHSHDAINVIDDDNFDTVGGQAFFTGVAPIARYVRVNYLNGGSPQSQFTLQTISTTEQLGPSTQPINSTLENNSVAVTTRSVLTGFDAATGSFNNIGSVDGRLQVESVNVAAQLSERFRRYAVNGTSREMSVNGSLGSPVEFIIDADPTNELTVDFISIQAFASGIKIDKFLGLNQDLTNGLLIEIKSEDKLFQFLPITNTTEFNSLFAFGSGRAFDLVFASGNDSMVATFGPNSPFILKPQGTYATNDYIKVIVRDNISSITRLRALAGGRVK